MSLVHALASPLTSPEPSGAEIQACFAALHRSQLILELAPSGEILVANENFLSTFGYDLNDIVGRHHVMFVTEQEAKSESYRAFWRRLRAGEFFSDTFHRIAKDGSDVWIQGVYNPVLDASGRPYKIIKVASNVTALEGERRTAVAQNLKALEQAETALLAKARLLANVSHELRTPLAAMIGLADLLSKTSLQAEQASLVSEIRGAGEVLESLVNDLLSTAQLEAGAVQIHLEATDATAVAHTVQSLLTPRARDKQLRLDVQAEDLPPALMLDGLRLRQILTNLVNNAIKFTAEGAVTIELTWREAVLYGVVSDTGEGFPPEEAERLFLPFEQRRETRAHSAGGVGLGLAICADLIAAMGGTIRATSRPGQGARFCFDLPAPKCSPHPCPTAPRRAKAPKTRRLLNVLVAEDNDALQRIMSSLLTSLGCRVTLASNGQDAVRLYQQHPPRHFDICFMDLRMPVMDGVQAMRAIRALERSSHLPIIAVSADVLDGRDMIEQAQGFDGFSPKPVSAQTIATHLDALYAPSHRPSLA